MQIESSTKIGAILITLASATMGVSSCWKADSTVAKERSVASPYGSGTFLINSMDVEEVASALRQILIENSGHSITNIVFGGYTNSSSELNGFVVLIAPNLTPKTQEVLTVSRIDAFGLANKISLARSDADIDHIVRVGYENSDYDGNGFVIVVSRIGQDKF